MNSEWIAKYEENEIRITNSWLSGEKLYVNNQLQDEQLNYITPSRMAGNLLAKNGQKLNIKANISGLFRVSCRLFIDNTKVDLKQTK